MIRICHLQVFPLLSGAQRSMLESLKQLDRARYEVEVVCKNPGPLTEELDRLRIPVHFAPSLDRPLRPWRDYKAYRELCRIFAAGRYDIVHTHSSKPGVLGRIAARRVGVPCVIHHVHAFAFHEFSPWPKRWFYGQIERRAARYCDQMLFVNREERDFVVDEGWLPAENCLTVYNGADLDAAHPRNCQRYRQIYRSQWRAADDEIIILFLGRLEYPKQPLLLAEIAASLERLRPHDAWRLVVAGSGPDEAPLARAIEALGVQHRVKLLGWQTDPLAVLHAADVTLLTSLAEGLPRSLIEAQAVGLPIVASAAKGNREVVTEESGFLCPPKDPTWFARALARLIDFPEMRAAMGRAARRHAEQCFDSVANNRQIVDVYESLLAA
jgi:glycosyltransferase involved in cell wall biosynthesis